MVMAGIQERVAGKYQVTRSERFLIEISKKSVYFVSFFTTTKNLVTVNGHLTQNFKKLIKQFKP